MELYLLNTDTTHSNSKPSEFVDDDATRVYLRKPSGRVLVAQTSGRYTDAQARVEMGQEHTLIADQTNRRFGTARVVAIENTEIVIGETNLLRNKAPFYVYK